MQELKPMIGYYLFLIFLLGLGLFSHYGIGYIKRRKEEKDKELLK